MMLKDSEISEGELCWFAFKYPSAFRLIVKMIKAGEFKVIRDDRQVQG